jgi:protein arginine kinase activator
MLDSFANPFSNLHDNIFGGLFGIPSVKSLSEEKKCPTCASTYSEIAKCGKVGCPDCYTTFRAELSRLIGSVHGTTSHTGQAPARHRAKQARDEQLKKLRRDLQIAIEKEDYEGAAKLRDEIRALNDEEKKEDA